MSFATIVYLALLLSGLLFAAWEAWLLLLFLRGRRRAPCPSPRAPAPLPDVTVQVPLYNERYAAARVIRAVGNLDYPPAALQIQVLDDSTDDTTAIAAAAVRELRERGLDAELIHRTDRRGFKAGALAEGLHAARGTLVAVFDADFLPDPDFLTRLVAEDSAFDDPRVGFVQARWEYLNRDHNLCTRAQGLFLDRFFLMVNPVRQTHGYVIQFNGSGGVWRRACIDDAGGWTADTLTEDLDLSYRAALRGWRAVYRPDVAVVSELPPDVASFKRQQRRWARGSTQCLRKLGRRVLAAPWPWPRRVAEVLTIAGYHTQALVFLSTALWPFFVLFVEPPWLLPLSQILLAPLWWMGPVSFLVASRARGGAPPGRTASDLAAAVAIAQGATLSATLAIVGGYLGRSAGTFERTPKGPGGDTGAAPGYTVPRDWTLAAEGLVVAFCLASFAALVAAGRVIWAFPMLAYAGGFGLVVAGQLGPVRPARAEAIAVPAPPE